MIIELDATLIGDSSGKYEGNPVRRFTLAADKLKEEALAIAQLGAATGFKFRVTLASFDDDGNPEGMTNG